MALAKVLVAKDPTTRDLALTVDGRLQIQIAAVCEHSGASSALRLRRLHLPDAEPSNHENPSLGCTHVIDMGLPRMGANASEMTDRCNRHNIEISSMGLNGHEIKFPEGASGSSARNSTGLPRIGRSTALRRRRPSPASRPA